MKIGIAYDLKSKTDLSTLEVTGLPDDLQEEFDSPVTIDAIATVLRSLGHEVIKLGDGRELLQRLLAQPLDFVFNIAEGEGIARSREARVPAVLEMLGIPFTGSDPLTLAVTLDKDCARRLAASHRIAVPAGLILVEGMDVGSLTLPDSFCFPAILKPAWEGSSKGIRNYCVVDNREHLAPIVDVIRRDYRQPVLLEEFIDGDELTVGIVGNKPGRIIGVMRVVPTRPTNRFVYGLEVKRDWKNCVRYECPPQLPAEIIEKICRAAIEVYDALGCRDIARVDFRLRNNTPYFLEVNPLPGLNPDSSDLVILARESGWTYSQLIESILQSALNRQSINTSTISVGLC